MSPDTRVLTVCPATPENAAAMAELWHICTAEVAQHEPIYTPYMDRAALTALLADELATGARLGWIAQDGGDLAGYVTCRIKHELPVFPPRPHVYVIDLDVAPTFRRRGVSRLLMGEVEAFARAQGIARVELAVAAADARAQAVWAQHGFQPHLVMMYKVLL